ncbi:hypothetical protein EDD11_001778 [Mortierella claussenii]|nr:hypothetical protein EDD11_001778 [Mortierella claussenii]
MPILNLIPASGSKGEATLSTVEDSSSHRAAAPDDGHGSNASQSLERIIRRSSHISLASTSTRATDVAVSEGDPVSESDSIKTPLGQSGLAGEETAATSKPTQPTLMAPPFIGTMLEGHAFTAAASTPPISEPASALSLPTYQPSESLLASNTKEPQLASKVTENEARDNSDNMSEKQSSLSALATWWSSGSSSNNSSSHERHHTPEHGLCESMPTAADVSIPSSPTAVSSSNAVTATIDNPDDMDWEPSGPEATFLQKSRARKRSNTNYSCSSLPSSLPSSASYPASMIKHSKVAASVQGRRGSTSSAQGSLTSMLWSKLAATQDNILAAAPPSPAKDSFADRISTTATRPESTCTEKDTPLTSGLAIASTYANNTGSSSQSREKRWSLFGYGAKGEDDVLAPTHTLQKNGDVLVEAVSRPASAKGMPIPVDGQVSKTGDLDTTDPKPDGAKPASLSESSQSPAKVTTEIAQSSEEGGPVAPALVGTSEVSVVVPPGSAVTKGKKDSTFSNHSTASNRYSWLSMIPGYGNKTEDATVSLESMRASHQVTDYEEGDRKDAQGNTFNLTGKPKRRTLAELAEARNANEALSSKEVLKEGENQEDSIVKEAGKAVASLSKVILKKKNVVLPNYYDQYPDVRQSLITLPIYPLDASTEKPTHTRSSSLMKSAVSALGSLLFSKTSAEDLPTPEPKDDALHRGANGIKKVVIIGVHGWFPVKLIRTVIGEPTGTSRKFCDEMNSALLEYLKIHNVKLMEEDITLIPLEGEGKVMNRVDILYENLVKNEEWKNALHEADLVMVATHSQGTPTSTMLIARLIDEGMLRVQEDDPKMQRVGILAMAGISHGPFPFLKGNLIVRWFEAEAAQELFEFMDSETGIAKKYRDALKTVLSSGVRFTLVASLEDQVVPLYSAVMTAVHHPSIVRAVYVDGATYQDDFLTNLISFSLRLRNSGVDDHGVLVHLSEAVAGSIYGEGHSTIYEEREVYMLAIRSLLEPPESLTSEMARSDPILHPFQAKQSLNPFYLPWGMRGVMDEIKALGNEALDKEMERLKTLYDEWNPVAKGMKEIKFRLEPTSPTVDMNLTIPQPSTTILLIGHAGIGKRRLASCIRSEITAHEATISKSLVEPEGVSTIRTNISFRTSELLPIANEVTNTSPLSLLRSFNTTDLTGGEGQEVMESVTSYDLILFMVNMSNHASWENCKRSLLRLDSDWFLGRCAIVVTQGKCNCYRNMSVVSWCMFTYSDGCILKRSAPMTPPTISLVAAVAKYAFDRDEITEFTDEFYDIPTIWTNLEVGSEVALAALQITRMLEIGGYRRSRYNLPFNRSRVSALSLTNGPSDLGGRTALSPTATSLLPRSLSGAYTGSLLGDRLTATHVLMKSSEKYTLEVTTLPSDKGMDDYAGTQEIITT